MRFTAGDRSHPLAAAAFVTAQPFVLSTNPTRKRQVKMPKDSNEEPMGRSYCSSSTIRPTWIRTFAKTREAYLMSAEPGANCGSADAFSSGPRDSDRGRNVWV
jgi:hypothetical protein